MRLNEVIKNAPDIEIKQLSCDSRIPMKDCIFFCLKGIKYDGHNYIDEAIKNGAKVIIYSDKIDTSLKAIYIKVPNVLNYLIKISNVFYDNPQNKLYSFLVAGTYGRSCVSSMINDLMSNYKKCASIGVYGINYEDTKLYSIQPALNILDAQRYLSQFVKSGMETVTLEANNISFDYRKLDFIKPNVFVYTNTSKEKIARNEDYVLTIQRYLYTLDSKTKVILNKDDIAYNDLSKALESHISYGQNKDADYVIDDIETTLYNTSFSLTKDGTKYKFNSKLVGMSNLYNSVAAIVAMNVTGYDLGEISLLFNFTEQRDGIYEKIACSKYNIYVDAAFYRESYENILKFFKNISSCRIISLISVSATDEKSRLSYLIKVANDYSDQIIVTEDSSYDYDINDTLNLCEKYVKDKPCLFVEDRQTAIEEGIDLLNDNDIFLVLGKGNEKYMYKGLVKQNYDGDANIVRRYLEQIDKQKDADDCD